MIASDFGGILRQTELGVLNSHSADIIAFLNKGGGLYAMAEGNNGAGLTPNGSWFGYLPLVATSTDKNQSEVGNTLTAFGASIGLTTSDVSGNASHNVFGGTFGLSIVDQDPAGSILSLAGRGSVDNGGVGMPEPASLGVLAQGPAAFGLARRRAAQAGFPRNPGFRATRVSA